MLYELDLLGDMVLYRESLHLFFVVVSIHQVLMVIMTRRRLISNKADSTLFLCQDLHVLDSFDPGYLPRQNAISDACVLHWT